MISLTEDERRWLIKALDLYFQSNRSKILSFQDLCDIDNSLVRKLAPSVSVCIACEGDQTIHGPYAESLIPCPHCTRTDRQTT